MTAKQAQVFESPSDDPKGRAQSLRPFLLAAAAAIVLLVIAGSWSFQAVQGYVDDSYREILVRIRNSNVASLRHWADRESAFVGMWAQDPQVQGKAAELRQWYRSQPPNTEQLQGHEAQAALRGMLTRLVAPKDITSYRILTRGGTVLASNDDHVVGLKTSAKGMAFLAPMLEGQPFVSRPFARGELLVGRDLAPGEYRILVGQALSAHDTGPPDLFLEATLDPEADFTRILRRNPPGETGDVYAFDRRGWMISESHFSVAELQSIGLLPTGRQSSMDLRVCDPGVDLTVGGKSPMAVGQRPLTRMAAAAVAGESGVDVDGYRDYRGVLVLGAWEWIDELGFGVAVEVDRAEAWRVLQPVLLPYGGLFLVLVVAIGVILFSYWRLLKLQRQVGQFQRLGRYTLLHEIGAGGMGKVYYARHAMLRRPTAVKLIRPDKEDESMVKRFEREVQLTSTLTHPNTVQIYDYGVTAEGVFYYAMEYLPGIGLDTLTNLEGPLPPARVVHILRQAVSALAEAHAIGLIHRDIKPSNMILCERGRQKDVLKLLDFGLVKEFKKPSMSELTAPDMVGGTPGYLPPERMKDSTILGPGTDIYALGVVAFNLLTARPLFDVSSVYKLTTVVTKEDPPRPSTCVKDLPRELDDLVHECCARDPEERPASAEVLLERLKALSMPRWTQRDAEAWWSKHADLLEAPGEKHAPAMGTTVAARQVS